MLFDVLSFKQMLNGYKPINYDFNCGKNMENIYNARI